jgi:predicted AlkP superfamily phosphohydrolase/phosphomutase
MDKTLKELRNDISRERKYVDKKPYSHNIINFTLREIAAKFGKEEANKAVRELKLIKLGWSEEK